MATLVVLVCGCFRPPTVTVFRLRHPADACIEERRQPQPRNFGARRRLARRFDEGLLIEVELLTGTSRK